MDRRGFLRNALLTAAAVPALAGCTPQQAAQEPGTPVRPDLARKGIGMSIGKMFGVDQLNSLDVDWFYSWGAGFPAARPRADFIPMIWGRESVRQGSVDEVRSELDLSRAAALLGFNEPDHPAQADMSVSRAVNLWPQLEEPGLRLGSPAPVQPLGDWLKRFMASCEAKQLRVDFVAMHMYPSPDAGTFLDTVRKVHAYYGKPVWITEYAVADWDATAKRPSRYSAQDIRAFMADTVAGLREMPFVERFAWKTRAENDPIMGASALFRKDGSLTDTGELYRSL